MKRFKELIILGISFFIFSVLTTNAAEKYINITVINHTKAPMEVIGVKSSDGRKERGYTDPLPIDIKQGELKEIKTNDTIYQNIPGNNVTFYILDMKQEANDKVYTWSVGFFSNLVICDYTPGKRKKMKANNEKYIKQAIDKFKPIGHKEVLEKKVWEISNGVCEYKFVSTPLVSGYVWKTSVGFANVYIESSKHRPWGASATINIINPSQKGKNKSLGKIQHTNPMENLKKSNL